MKQELKDKWLKALRSGRYKQTQRRLWLRDNVNGYPAGNCCLGVLCRVARKRVRWDGDMGVFQGEAYVLTNALMDEFGIDGDTHDRLTYMNDDGKNFSEIADWIEDNVKVTP